MEVKTKGNNSPGSLSLRSLFSDIRVLQIIGQIVFTILLVGLISLVVTSIANNISARQLTINYTFLETRAGFAIADAPEWYSANNSYGEAFTVGIINTLRVVVLGLFGATVLGILAGIFLLSTNFLIRSIARAYVEILRNTPLLVQLYFWYYIVMLALPTYQNAIEVPAEGVTFISVELLIYLVMLTVFWFVSRRSANPSRIFGAALFTFFLFEVLDPLLVNDLGFTAFSAVLVILTFIMVLVAAFAPKDWRPVGVVYLVMILAQLIGSLFFQLFDLLNITPFSDAIVTEIYPAIYLSVQGLVFPEILATGRFAEWMAFVGIGIALAISIWMIAGHITETTGRPISRGLYALGALLAFAVAGWAIVSAAPVPDQTEVVVDGQIVLMDVDEALAQDLLTREEVLALDSNPVRVVLPEKGRFRFDTGSLITPEYTALLVGLVVYTSGFIAEIVRAGIQAVPYGQLEAARALGLGSSQTLQLIILPQALRVIIPPMGNQYLNLSKNSSLATAIAFADTYAVGITMMNQSGQSISGFSLVLVVYLTMSLIISAGMNFVNARFQLVTR